MTTPIFHDGFDVYGPVGLVNADLQTKLLEWWTSLSAAGGLAIVAGLSSTGTALFLTNANCQALKTFSAGVSRIAGTMRFKSNLGQVAGLTFRDGGTNQFSIVIETSGLFTIRNGSSTGTVLQTSAASVSADSVNVLSWDVAIGDAAAYTVYLNGQVLLSGTGDTMAGAAANVNAATAGILTAAGSGGTLTIDDLAILNGALAFPASFLTSNPRIETQIGSGDNQTQWDNPATLLGTAHRLTTSTNAPGANQLFLRMFTPDVNMTINSVACIPGATNVTAKLKAVIYSNSAGAPASLLSSGTEVVGTTSGATLVGALTTPQALTAGTAYWIGFITDSSVVLWLTDGGTNGVKAANTYSSGAPATAPAMTTGQSSWILYGNCTGATTNWSAVKHNPAPGDIASISSETLNDEDLYNFPVLTTNPTTIYFGAVRANMKRSDAGARTVDLRVKSNTMTSSGSSAGQSPALSYGWLASWFENDPNTGSPFTVSGWNAAKAGLKIAS